MTNRDYIRPLATTVTTQERLWLVKLMEECAELQQAAAKVLRHGWKSFNPDASHLGDNEQQFRAEIDDVDEAIQEINVLRPRR